MNDKIHESAGVENAEDKSIVVESDDESIGVNSESTGVSKANNMALIDEAITEAEQNTVEGTELFARNTDNDISKDTEEGEPWFNEVKVETEETWDEHVIHMDAQVLTRDNVYNLWRQGDRRTDYTHQCGFS